jgi:hypothetical protein
MEMENNIYNINGTIIVVFFITIVVIYVLLNFIKNLHKKKTGLLIKKTEDLIYKNDWNIYKYKFLKKIIYLNVYYKSKFNDNIDLLSIVKNSKYFKDYCGLSYSMFFNEDTINKINIIIEENPQVFNNLFDNDHFLIRNKEIMDEIGKSVIDLKNHYNNFD